MALFTDRKPKKIFILLGHPDSSSETLSSQLATSYETAARHAGHEVMRLNLCDLAFDPILHHGYRSVQALEPDLLKVQEAMRWADHVVIVYPVWWAAMPALLKGFFDRLWLPGFAYNMRKTKEGKRALGWHKRLKGKTARIIALTSSHPLLFRLMFGNFTNDLTHSILWFAGFQTATTRFGPSETAPERKRKKWHEKVARLGALGE